MSEVLRVRGLRAGYGGADVLHGIELSVDEGEIVAVLGANGAGKTTTLRAISGLIRSSGAIEFLGNDLTRRAPFRRVADGLAHVPQGRGTLSYLTVTENLWAGAHRLGQRARRERVAGWLEVFPRLAERRHQSAGSLSGGEQQLLAIARAMIAEPALVLLDEPSLGLAPLMVETVFSHLARINAEQGTAMVVVEQNATASLGIAHRAYVLEAGRITIEGPASELSQNDDVRRAYLGV